MLVGVTAIALLKGRQRRKKRKKNFIRSTSLLSFSEDYLYRNDMQCKTSLCLHEKAKKVLCLPYPYLFQDIHEGNSLYASTYPARLSLIVSRYALLLHQEENAIHQIFFCQSLLLSREVMVIFPLYCPDLACAGVSTRKANSFPVCGATFALRKTGFSRGSQTFSKTAMACFGIISFSETRSSAEISVSMATFPELKSSTVRVSMLPLFIWRLKLVTF